jgi:hypothetical protein
LELDSWTWSLGAWTSIEKNKAQNLWKVKHKILEENLKVEKKRNNVWSKKLEQTWKKKKNKLEENEPIKTTLNSLNSRP